MCATIEDRAHYRRVKVLILINLPWYCEECCRSKWFLGIVRNTVDEEGETANDQDEVQDNGGANGEENDIEEEDDDEEEVDGEEEGDGEEVNGDRTDHGHGEMDIDAIDVQDPSVSYKDRTAHDESSLVDDVVNEPVIHGDQDLIWHIIDGATKRGGAHLVNSLGYTYVRHKQSKEGDAQYWTCARKTAHCKARVVQRQDSFTCGWKSHICHPLAGAIELATVRATVRSIAKSHQFVSAQEIVNKVC